jgi:protein-disulfide isomerase/peroxiredoxin/uncharacterized membrane protein
MAKNKKGNKRGSASAPKPALKQEEAAPEVGTPAGAPAAEMTADAAPATPDGALSQAWLAGLLVALVVGIGLAGYLTKLHLDLFYGGGVESSLCDFGSLVECSSVNASSWSALFPNSLHIPQSLLALPTYLLMGFLGVMAWRKGRGSVEMALLFGLGLIATVYGLVLLVNMLAGVKAICLFCIGLDVVNILVTFLAYRASRTSIAALVARGLGGLRHPVPVASGAVVFVLGFAIAWVWYAGSKNEAIDAKVATLDAGGDAAPAAVAKAPDSPRSAVPTTTRPAGDPAGGKARKLRIMEERFNLELPAHAPILGNPEAKVTVVEFSDFQCPFCKRLSGTVHRLVEEYPKDVRVAFLNFPMKKECNATDIAKSMHPMACLAAQAAYCAGKQGKFWELHDLMFARQSKLGGKELVRLAKRAGLDDSSFRSCVNDPATLEAVKLDSQVGGSVGVSGTPALFVNGRRLIGAQPIEVLRRVIDAELAGETGALDLELQVGAERIGTVEGTAETVAVDWGRYPFEIDAFEAVVRDGKAEVRVGEEVTGGLTWYDAKEACEAVGKRMCTEEEWFAACSGIRPVDENRNGIVSDDFNPGRDYAYGKHWDPGACADDRGKATPGELTAGNHPDCRTPEGVFDLHGNVKEWAGLTPADATVKGGSYYSGESARCGYNRDDIAPDTVDPSLGVRCCSGALPAELQPDPNAYRGGKVGDKLMSFSAKMLDGGSFSSKQLDGKPTILVFWASWCGPCKKEMPILNELYSRYKDQGLKVIGVTVDEDPKDARVWLEENVMSFPILSDPKSELVDRFQTRGVPTTFWILPDGQIRQRTVGVPGGGEQRLDQFAKDLLGI